MRRRSFICDQQGFTLVEMMVAMLTGVIVIFATFAILEVALSQSSRIADRVSADRRSRIAMEQIILILHSSCVAPETTPVEPKSEGNKLLIISQTGAAPTFATVFLHELAFTETAGKGTLTDTTYPNTGAKPAPNWEFSTTAASRQTLLTGVTRSETATKQTIPIFQYFKYEGSKLSETPLVGELTEATANEVAAISVSFTAAPESGNIGKVAGARTVDLADTAVLRFSPSSPSATNLACA
jgi:Tfp pilus assembly protein PilW